MNLRVRGDAAAAAAGPRSRGSPPGWGGERAAGGPRAEGCDGHLRWDGNICPCALPSAAPLGGPWAVALLAHCLVPSSPGDVGAPGTGATPRLV